MSTQKIKEKDIQKAILDWLKLSKIFCYKNSTVGIFKKSTGAYIPSQSVGSPDIVCVIEGRYVGMEVKKPGYGLRESQVEFRRALEAAGGEYHIVRSVDEAQKVVQSVKIKYSHG